MTAPRSGFKVAILSLSTIASDPRVQRQARALVADGWQVTTVGFGENDGGPRWMHRSILQFPYERHPLVRGLRICGLLASRAIPQAAHWVWHQQAQNDALLRAVNDLEVDLVIACDYITLPAAITIGAPIIYDSHEYAVREKEESAVWSVLYPPYIRVIEREGLMRAAIAMTVSDGIAAAMKEEYGLASPPEVIRNLPSYRAMPFRPPGRRLIVHHHGVLVPGRGLELLIRSVPLWQPRFSLRLRGPIAPDYCATLQRLIERCGAADRVTIAPPLPMDSLITDAWEADIGIHLLPDFGIQNRFALPNKLFEFLMAGLAVVTSDLPEMRRIVENHGAGVVVANTTVEGVAATINALDANRVTAFKLAALAAARNLCWDIEKERFLALCRMALAQPNAAARTSAARSAALPSP